MKKQTIFSLMAALVLTGALVSCDKNDNPDDPQVKTSGGFYTINNGNMAGSISSSITTYDYTTNQSTPALQDAFKAANGIELGDGAQPAIIYDDKMFIPVYDSNLIWVVNPETLEIITSIRPEAPATGPRALAAADGKIYVSLFTGYVSRIDAKTLKIEKTIATGPNTEQMAIANGKLYVANSDGYNYEDLENQYTNCSISIIDLKTWTQTYIRDTDKVLNPTDMATNGKDVFVLCKGNYGFPVPSTVKKITGDDVIEIAQASYITVHDDDLYVINCPYGMSHADMSFDIYDTKSLKLKGTIAKQTEGTDSWIDAPAGIAVDPYNGNIIILSYHITEAGFSQYMQPCYANIYDKGGNFKTRIECGVGALGVTFFHK
ncbi:MAG: hypothetical protein K2H86_08515 [Muribaculaceae bacterium]|nr:hypothetical protein [Muribaculaceae bacterium]